MLGRCVQWLCVASLAIIALTSTASAATFDLIWPDRIDITTFPGNVGFTADYALVVNKGLTNIEAAEFFGTSFTATSSNPAVTAQPFINNPGPAITPILPNQAIGSLIDFSGVLTAKLLAGETFHNTTPLQVIALHVDYPPGFSGSVVFDLTMTMGGNTADYQILATFTPGSQFAISFPSAARVSSHSIPTAARRGTWGAIKRLYR